MRLYGIWHIEFEFSAYKSQNRSIFCIVLKNQEARDDDLTLYAFWRELYYYMNIWSVIKFYQHHNILLWCLNMKRITGNKSIELANVTTTNGDSCRDAQPQLFSIINMQRPYNSNDFEDDDSWSFFIQLFSMYIYNVWTHIFFCGI